MRELHTPWRERIFCAARLVVVAKFYAHEAPFPDPDENDFPGTLIGVSYRNAQGP